MATAHHNPSSIIVRVPSADLALPADIAIGETGDELTLNLTPDAARRLGLELVNAKPADAATLKRLGFRLPVTGSTTPPMMPEAASPPPTEGEPQGQPTARVTAPKLPDFLVRVPGLGREFAARFLETGIEEFGLMLIVTASEAKSLGVELLPGEPVVIADRLREAGYTIPTASEPQGEPQANPTGLRTRVAVGARVAVWREASGQMEHATVIETSPLSCVVRTDPDEGGETVAAVWSEIYATDCGPAAPGEPQYSPAWIPGASMRVGIPGHAGDLPAAPGRFVDGGRISHGMMLFLDADAANELKVSIRTANPADVGALWGLGFSLRSPLTIADEDDAHRRRDRLGESMLDGMDALIRAGEGFHVDIVPDGDEGFVKAERLRIGRMVKRLHADAATLLADASMLRGPNDDGTPSEAPVGVNPFRTAAGLAREILSSISTGEEEIDHAKRQDNASPGMDTFAATQAAHALADALAKLADQLDESRACVTHDGTPCHIGDTDTPRKAAKPGAAA